MAANPLKTSDYRMGQVKLEAEYSVCNKKSSMKSRRRGDVMVYTYIRGVWCSHLI